MMKLRTTKKLLAGALAAGLLTLQPVTAMAASNAQTGWGAKMGIEYLASQQLESGQVPGGLGGDSDWAVIALAAAGQDPRAFQKNGVSVVDFIATDPTVKPADEFRRMLAAAAAGFDETLPKATFVSQLTAQYDGTQLGDPQYLNDDIFGIMAAAALDDASLATLAANDFAYLLSAQNSDGGFAVSNDCTIWCYSDTSMTAAAIVAMRAAAVHGFADPETENFQTALVAAVTYLLLAQDADGGFLSEVGAAWPADTLSTAWALMALNALEATDQAKDARDWLLARQNADGGFDGWTCGASDVSVTVHAVTALLGTTWLLDPAASIEIPDTAPAPVTRFDCNPSTETPTEEPTEPLEEVVVPPTPTVTTASTTKTTTTQQPQTLAEETTAEDTTTSQASQENLETAIEDEKAAAKADSSTGKYILYTLIALALITTGWRLLQPKKS